MNRKKKLIITMAIALILLVGVTVSYGYIALVSTSKNQEVSVSTGNIHLVFDDADTDNVNANLKLGQSITKTFKIENKGTKPGRVQINWKNLINTYNSRSLSYTLESSNNKTSGYTAVEVIRENVPVSTEAKEVPLSKEITIPVGNNPIYYRVTITFNNLSDVDQSGDVNAKLITEFSLSEPENISKKVIAVLDGNVKTNELNFLKPSPAPATKTEEYRYIKKVTMDATKNENYVLYGDNYEITENSKFSLVNPRFAKYKDVYSTLAGKYIALFNITADQVAEEVYSIEDAYNRTNIDFVEYASATDYKRSRMSLVDKYNDVDFSSASTEDMSTSMDDYILYGETYTYNGRYYILDNPKTCQFSDPSCRNDLVGKYISEQILADEIDYKRVPNDIIAHVISVSDTSYVAEIKEYAKTNGILVDYSNMGVFKAEDDYGDSYYYRGGVTNNYFKFGGFYWRIIRVNGDGSIRMIYAGTTPHENGQLTEGACGINSWDDALGYMYGNRDTASNKLEFDANDNDSPMKAAIDTWYEHNLKVNTANNNADLGNYLGDELFCSDRTVASGAGLWERDDTALGYGKNLTYYGSYNRIKNGIPSLKCPVKSDRFTKDENVLGNAKLKYKVATITSDEAMFAGLAYNYNNAIKNYLTPNFIGGGTYQTMSPYSTKDCNNSGYNSCHFMIGSLNKFLNSSFESSSPAYQPVINIAPEHAISVIGSGTMNDPFMIPGVN